jgi:UDP-sugar transporter A1/2/3
VALLGRGLGVRRWLSLVVLTLGVSVVSLPSSNANDLAMDIHDFSDHFFPRSMHELGQFAGGVSEVARELTKRGLDSLDGLGSQLTRRSASYEGIKEDLDTGLEMNYSVGLTAVLVSALVSGLSGVYFEKVLKDSASSVSVWTRNIQMSFYSLLPAFFIGVIVNDGDEIAKHGFFDGYNSIVWLAIVFQAVGGILTSLCINYADNIAKNFATSISIIVSFVFSMFVFGFSVNLSVRCSLIRPFQARLTRRSLCSAQHWSSCQHTCTAYPRGNAGDPLRSALRATKRPPSTAHQPSLTRTS